MFHLSCCVSKFVHWVYSYELGHVFYLSKFVYCQSWIISISRNYLRLQSRTTLMIFFDDADNIVNRKYQEVERVNLWLVISFNCVLFNIAIISVMLDHVATQGGKWILVFYHYKIFFERFLYKKVVIFNVMKTNYLFKQILRQSQLNI